jgi:hypothetical protein
MNDDRLDRIEELLNTLVHQVKAIETKVEDLYEYDDAEPERESETNRFIDENEIFKLGAKVPYNKLEGAQVSSFRAFLSDVRMNEKRYTQKELENASFADKNFSDIRISDNMRRSLSQLYEKTYRKAWDFRFIRGYLCKYEGQKAWQWSDGSKD